MICSSSSTLSKMKTKAVKKPKEKTKLERDIYRVIINSNPLRSPDGQLKEIIRLFKEEIGRLVEKEFQVSQTQPQEDVDT